MENSLAVVERAASLVQEGKRWSSGLAGLSQSQLDRMQKSVGLKVGTVQAVS